MSLDAKIAEADGEVTVRYALRLRSTGEILRVETRAETYGDAESPYAQNEYSLSTDPSEPVFTAGSAEELALLFARDHAGSSREMPYLSGYKHGDVEPVAIEEVVTRRIRPTGIPFDVPVTVDGRYVIDVHPSFSGQIEGLREVLDAFEATRPEVEGTIYPGSKQTWGKAYLVGKIVAGTPDSLPEGYAGAVVVDKERSNQGRRALTALPLPEKYIHLANARGKEAVEASLLICLSDLRPAPESLLQALADLRTGTAPAP